MYNTVSEHFLTESQRFERIQTAAIYIYTPDNMMVVNIHDGMLNGQTIFFLFISNL